jgi:hypothetical protein
MRLQVRCRLAGCHLACCGSNRRRAEGACSVYPCAASCSSLICCRQLRIEQLLARVMLDTERYNFSIWNMLNQQPKSDGDAIDAEVSAAVSVPPNATHSGLDNRHHHHSEAELAAIEESKIELEDQIIRSVAERLFEATSIAADCCKSLAEAVSQAIHTHKIEGSDNLNAVAKSKTAESQAPASSAVVAAAPAPARKSAALSVASLTSKAAIPDPEDDSAFDETVTPDGPVLKYGRNGVPELKQVICFLSSCVPQPNCFAALAVRGQALVVLEGQERIPRQCRCALQS